MEIRMRASFTRVVWANERAREVWEPRIAAIQAAWLAVELESVRVGLRSAGLVFGGSRIAASGLGNVALDGDRFAVGPRAPELAEAFLRGDNATVGALLGFPECCTSFFTRMALPGDWDSTWSMSYNPEIHYDCCSLNTVHEVSGPIECNILGRWLGVRLVPHLPCSFRCHATKRFGEQLSTLWPVQELAWARAILSWPMEWSARHGIAEVKYPVLKFSANTTEKQHLVVRRPSNFYPTEGARGISFPYRMDKPIDAIPMPFFRNVEDPNDNGFTSIDAMTDAHQMIVDKINDTKLDSVLDLGCGNGLLLTKLKADRKLGIEENDERASRGRAAGRDIRTGRIQDLDSLVDEKFDLALISQRRLDEMTNAELAAFQFWRRNHLLALLVYSYDAPMFARFL